MGDGIVGHITKGPVHRKLDDYLNLKTGGQFVNRAGFLQKLENQAATATQYLQIMQNDVGLTVAEVNYLDTRWYGTGGQILWPNLQPIYPVLRQGLIKALREAGTTHLLDSYWLPVAGQSLIGVVVAKSAVQVTRIIITPPSHMPAQARTFDSPMWVVTRQEHPPVQVGDPPRVDAKVEALAENNRVVIWRRLEFTASPNK